MSKYSRKYSPKGEEKITTLYGILDKEAEKPIYVRDVASKSEIILDANHFETLLLWDIWKTIYIAQDSTNSTKFQYKNGSIVDILNK